VKRSERKEAEYFFLKLWNEAVGKPGYKKEDWLQGVRAIWTNPEEDEKDCELDPRAAEGK
jgi:hypothetical protein